MAELLEIVGQDEALGQLQQAMRGERMPHAYLFAGPAGVGRRTTAVALARTLLCARPASSPNNGRLVQLPADFPLLQACGACDDCRMTAAESHPDLHVVYKELARYHEDPDVRERVMQELSIDVIRSFLIAPAYQRPGRGRGKVFVVLEAELMSREAQNALLKTLEEPPPGVTIVLISQRGEQLLPTTLSRCTTVRFGLLPREFVQQRLTEGGVEADEAAFWTGYTRGSLGRAQRLAEAGMYETKRQIVERLGRLGDGGDAELGDFLVKTMDGLAGAAVKAAKADNGVEASKRLAARQAAGTLLELIASVYADAMRLAAGGDLPVVHGDQAEALQAIAGRFRRVQLAEIVEQLSEYERLLWRNVNPKIIWDNVAITCASAAPLTL